MNKEPMTLNKYAALRKELSNPAIGSNHHLRKLALSLLDDLDGKEGRIKELDSQRALAFMACNRWRDKFDEAEAKLDAAKKQISELLLIAKEAADDADSCVNSEFNDDSMKHTKAIALWESGTADNHINGDAP